MEDEKIVELYWQRSESALAETQTKYGRYLNTVAQNILQSGEDAAECVNDALLAAWNAIPPAKPQMLQTFLGKLVRNLALDKWRAQSAEKRGGGRVAEALDELAELSDGNDLAESVAERLDFSALIGSFLSGLNEKDRLVFMKRYWHFMSVREIAEDLRLSESNVRVILHRCRKILKTQLEKEGFES